MKNNVAAIQMVTTGDVETNLQSAADLIAEASNQGAKLVLLPENFAVLDGGPLAEFAEREGDSEGLLQSFLSSQAQRHKIILVGGSIPLTTRPTTTDGLISKNSSAPEWVSGNRVRPACLVYDSRGQVMARYDKIHLFDVTVDDQQSRYSESLSYEPGDQVVVVATEVARLGLSICYDLRFPELYRLLFAQNIDLITVPSAFTKVTGEAHWETLLRARAIENQCYILAANQGGIHNSRRTTYGNSMIVDPWGTVLSRIGTGPGVVVAEIDTELIQSLKEKMPIAQHCRL